MSPSLIVPGAIPGVTIDAAAISGSAATFRSTATAIADQGAGVVTSWSGLSGVYAAPEAEQLFVAMDPVGTSTQTLGDTFGKVATLLDDLASAVAAPVARLKELVTEAEAFTAEVSGGVTYSTESYNSYISSGPDEVTVEWYDHIPSRNRNDELLGEVNAEVAKIDAARAECENGINALRTDPMCFPEQVAYTAEQLDSMKDLPYGAPGDPHKTCSESMGTGLGMFIAEAAYGAGALVGWDIQGGTGVTKEFGLQAWGGLLQGLGAIAITSPATIALVYAPPGTVPTAARPAVDWYRTMIEGVTQGIVGTPEMYDEDPVAAGTYATLGVASFFVPVGGAAVGATKATSGLARLGGAVERAGLRAPEGSALRNGLTHVGHAFTGLSERLRVPTDGPRSAAGGSDAPSRLGEQLDRLDDVVDVRSDGLAPPPTRVDRPDTTLGPVRGDDASAPPVREDASAPQVRDDDASAPLVREDAGGAGRVDDAPAADQPGRADGDAGTDGSGGDAPGSSGTTTPSAVDRSGMTREQLANYLDVINREAAREFREGGAWPADQRVPADVQFLGTDGKVDWTDIPWKGFAVDENKVLIVEVDPHIPDGTLLDRAGSADGVFVSPVPDSGVPFTHEQRATPWVPDPAIEHVYRTKGDLGDIRGAYDRSDAPTREQFDLSMSNHRKTWDDMHLMRGPIAPGFGQSGGGVQLLLPMSVQDLMDLGLIEEVKVPSA
ncbi:glycohydrolase toxin TNT-related protein [Frigoribacterium sp. VKM Ac-1396]|uniref:TNT domain-containing protein n=1 Tax=Frigoribacterium sp. VKM Ac-1396 TaxID=2783821 RepID=UPI00188CC623|nr:TNT domain-containing protein [Frigoribacterium sp. VKM Ac-1396]MBF4601817.1 glycohydrolase toxin TNT-related protein [Frigoribacterium sp. VKM Ac-1396]